MFVNSGFSITNKGLFNSDKNPFLYLILLSEITQDADNSLPAAAIVKIEPIRICSLGTSFFLTISKGSPS